MKYCSKNSLLIFSILGMNINELSLFFSLLNFYWLPTFLIHREKLVKSNERQDIYNYFVKLTESEHFLCMFYDEIHKEKYLFIFRSHLYSKTQYEQLSKLFPLLRGVYLRDSYYKQTEILHVSHSPPQSNSPQLC